MALEVHGLPVGLGEERWASRGQKRLQARLLVPLTWTCSRTVPLGARLFLRVSNFSHLMSLIYFETDWGPQSPEFLFSVHVMPQPHPREYVSTACSMTAFTVRIPPGEKSLVLWMPGCVVTLHPLGLLSVPPLRACPRSLSPCEPVHWLKALTHVTTPA